MSHDPESTKSPGAHLQLLLLCLGQMLQMLQMISLWWSKTKIRTAEERYLGD